VTATAEGQLLTLAVAGRRLGVPARSVREVARMPRLTPVPHAAPAMLGLANLRGTVLPVLSLGALTGGESGGERRLVVLDAAEPVALAVDGVAELIDSAAAETAAVEPVDALALVAREMAPAPRRIRATAAGTDEAEARAETLSLLTFAIGPQTFAFALDAVEEVLRLPRDIAAVPHADSAVVGSIAVRDTLLPLLSLPALLALPGQPLSARSRAVVVRIGEQRVGLVVDAMRSVARVDARAIDPVPLVLTRGDAEARIQAVCRLAAGELVSVLAPEHLLRADLTAQLGRSVPRAAEVRVDAERSEPFLVFTLAGQAFGLALAAIEHVAMVPPKLVRLPRALAFVRGVMPFGGETIPVIDQARRFGAAGPASARQRVVVVKLGARRAGVLVDTAAEIARVPVSALQPVPAEVDPVFSQVTVGAHERPVLVVDPAQLLDRTERDLLAAMDAPAS
jgi:purine-binding chemotaxis protein CheW